MDSFKSKQKQSSNVLCHIPHSSTNIPLNELSSFELHRDNLRNEVYRMADLLTEELYSPLHRRTSAHTATMSRLVLDVERFADDYKEPMSKVGMGVVYTKTSSGKVLRRVTPQDKKRIIDEYFIPYHAALTKQVQSILKRHGTCLIIDCHSFSDKPRAYEPSQKTPRPDICIGVDSHHTPKILWENLALAFNLAGFTVRINDPFAGSLVPFKYFRKNKKVHSIMVEVNRKLYMSEKTFAKKKQFKKISREICDIISKALADSK